MADGINFARKKYGLRIVEAYFESPAENPFPYCDIYIVLQSPTSEGSSTPYKTLHIDLNKPIDSIWSGFRANTKNEINRSSQRDNIIIEIHRSPSAEVINEFLSFYNEFAKKKKINPANKHRLSALFEKNGFTIAFARNELGLLLVVHGYITLNKRSRLLYSGSCFDAKNDRAFNALAGRANRNLTWECIKYFKSFKNAIYDFGGISDGGTQMLVNIDDFKRSFGGSDVVEYNHYILRSAIAKTAFKILSVLRRSRFEG